MMRVKMTPISISLAEARKSPPAGLDLNATFDVIVVGSGYGGAITAAKLAECGKSVLLLERGREILPGAYPRSLAEAAAETQITTAQGGRLTTTNGMLDLRINDDMSVVVGCGLGGTSLINANVALEAEPRLFLETETGPDGNPRPVWPAVLRSPLPPGATTMLDAQYDEARLMLGSVTLPDAITLPKLTTLEKSATAMGLTAIRTPINVTFKDGKNPFQNFQPACTLCGDCCSGCNYGAKNTTLMNYLPYAAANGAFLLNEAQVHTVASPDGVIWLVRAANFGEALASGIDLKARLVVLAAGTLGSTEILKRSLAQGKLAVAGAYLGRGFSGNGDVLGFGFNANWTEAAKGDGAPIYSIGAGTNTPIAVTPPSAYPYIAGPYTPGPCITGMIRVTMDAPHPVSHGVLIEDGVAPGPLAMAYPAIFFGDDVVSDGMMRFPDVQRRLQDVASLGTALMNGVGIDTLAYTAPMAQMQSYLLMSHDAAQGEIVFDPVQDIVKVVWPGVGRGAPFVRDNILLKQASDALWADYLANPVWSEPFGWKVVTTHPIGGCRMADEPAFGVVNADCQVFSGKGSAVYDGLMVCDGSVIPGSLGVNPLLTISAVTIRAMDRLITRNGWAKIAAPKPASSSTPDTSAPPVAVDPLPEILRMAQRVHQLLSDYVDRIALGPAQAKAVADEIYAWLETFVATYKGVQKLAMQAALFAAYEAEVQHMVDDVGLALQTLVDDLEGLIGILKTDDPDSTKITSLVAYLTALVGDISAGLSFTETMEGYVSHPKPGRSHPISDPFQTAAATGRAEGCALNGTFTVTSTDMQKLLSDPQHKADLSGLLTLSEPGKPDQGFAFSGGTFELLTEDQTAIDKFLMVYQADLPGGGQFHGFKTLKRREGSNWWTDLTTLATTLTLPGAAPLQGQMTLGVEDLVRQVLTVKGNIGGTSTLRALILQVLAFAGMHNLKGLVALPEFLNTALRTALADYAADGVADAVAGLQGLEGLATVSGAEFFANLIFRTYGGLPAYLDNFPRQHATPNPMPDPNGGKLPNPPGTAAQTHAAVLSDGARVQLTRFMAGTKGPIILANGFGFRGLAFAANTTEQSLVGMLAAEGYDVWIFDHRASPANMDAAGNVNIDYTMDDIANIDWPWAVDFVRATRKTEGTDKGSVKLLVHCLGGLTAMMALQAGKIRDVRQMIVSQFTSMPVAGWFNQMKADLGLAGYIRAGVGDALADAIGKYVGNLALTALLKGSTSFDLRTTTPPIGTPTDQQSLDLLINTALWNVPFPPGESCQNPTCHRVFGVFGPVYSHTQLNEATHDALNDIAGPVATLPFEQLALIMQAGRAVDASGGDVYFGNPAALDFPIHFISGALNQLVMPETTLRSLRWLQEALPGSAAKFTRQVFPGYGHLDCLVGRTAATDVLPSLLDRLKVFA